MVEIGTGAVGVRKCDRRSCFAALDMEGFITRAETISLTAASLEVIVCLDTGFETNHLRNR